MQKEAHSTFMSTIKPLSIEEELQWHSKMAKRLDKCMLENSDSEDICSAAEDIICTLIHTDYIEVRRTAQNDLARLADWIDDTRTDESAASDRLRHFAGDCRELIATHGVQERRRHARNVGAQLGR